MNIILIGDLGGGKTTLAAYFNLWVQYYFPDTPAISNVEIDCATVVQDTNKFLAIKLMKKDTRYALFTTDEAAQSGFESRGSGTKAAALESRVVTLSRKAGIDWIIVSQLMSMIDKRVQWLGNLYIYCEAVWEDDNYTPVPSYFDYSVYDTKLNEIDGFELNFQEDCVPYIFPHMKTNDIPYLEELTKQWINFYSIVDEDVDFFEQIMDKGVR